MTRLSNRRLAAVLLSLFMATHQGSGHANADDEMAPLVIGYVEMAEDVRYRHDSAYAGIVYRDLGRPYPGARLGIEDARLVSQVIGRDVRLERKTASTIAEIGDAVARWSRDHDTHFVIADLPSAELVTLADAVDGLPILIMNVSATDDSLRGEQCRGNIVHVAPSEAMLADTLVQYLVAKRWTRILALQGPADSDARKVEALQNSAAKFGAEVLEVRPFTLGTDPRRRDQNNVALVTGGINADAVYVSDASGEMARYVPYQTAKPVPVVGDAGLSPTAWHWSWNRHGAPQLQHRFEELARPHRMNGQTWAAWTAVKAVMQAAMRSEPPEFEDMRHFVLGPDLRLDGSKGNPMSVRDWNGQLRQPILLATPDAVIARAPLPEFLHRTDVLDTLGVDRAESKCRPQDEGRRETD